MNHTHNAPKVSLIALVGHCLFDGPHMQSVLSRMFPTVRVERVNDEPTAERYAADPSAVLLVNRGLVGEIGYDNDEGMALIRHLREKDAKARIALISDYADVQRDAEELGAKGFGKSIVDDREALAHAMEPLLA
jgi:ActR/RegA family two-component response regulator